MIIERFRNGPAPVYARFHERGRLAPSELHYINSWLSEDMSTCYQVMECVNRKYLEQWMTAWQDLVDFEVIPVMESKVAASKFA